MSSGITSPTQGKTTGSSRHWGRMLPSTPLTGSQVVLLGRSAYIHPAGIPCRTVRDFTAKPGKARHYNVYVWTYKGSGSNGES